MLIDTHCHLDAAEFDTDRERVADDACEAGVQSIVIPAVERANFSVVRELAGNTAGGAYALGIHPLYVQRASDSDLDALRAAVKEALGDPRFVAIGEIGLDFFVPEIASGEPRERQERFYAAQLALAAEFGLPVLLHVRRAHAPMIATLKRYKLERSGVIHAFSGSWEEAREYLRLGFRLGLGGAGTWPQAQRMHRVLRQLPLEAIVLETDAPDIPPAGHAGERNSPELLPEICRRLADLKGIDAHALAAASYRNSCELFGWR